MFYRISGSSNILYYIRHVNCFNYFVFVDMFCELKKNIINLYLQFILHSIIFKIYFLSILLLWAAFRPNHLTDILQFLQHNTFLIKKHLDIWLLVVILCNNHRVVHEHFPNTIEWLLWHTLWILSNSVVVGNLF